MSEGVRGLRGGGGRQIGRSLFITENMNPGDIFNEQNIRSIRPGYGLEPKFINDFIGKPCKIEVKKGTPVTWDMV